MNKSHRNNVEWKKPDTKQDLQHDSSNRISKTESKLVYGDR